MVNLNSYFGRFYGLLFLALIGVECLMYLFFHRGTKSTLSIHPLNEALAVCHSAVLYFILAVVAE